jgi:hypothetical protein
MQLLSAPLFDRVMCNVQHALGVSPRENWQLKRESSVIHIGSRCYSLIEVVEGRQCIKKVFARTADGRRSFINERLARKEFADHEWMTPCVRIGRNWLLQNWLTCAMYCGEARLDKVAYNLSRAERRRVAGQAVAIIHDMYRRGFAHRDFHARNLFYVDGQLKLIDFETFAAFPVENRPPFIESYDVTGYGLDSPFLTGHMGYSSRIPYSVSSVLGIGIAEAIDAYGNCA